VRPSRATTAKESAAPHLVIPTEVIMGLRPTQGDENRRETRSLAMEFKGRATLRLVIPTEAYPGFLLRKTDDVHVCGFA
jgi:hypothetical protein